MARRLAAGSPGEREPNENGQIDQPVAVGAGGCAVTGTGQGPHFIEPVHLLAACWSKGRLGASPAAKAGANVAGLATGVKSAIEALPRSAVQVVMFTCQTTWAGFLTLPTSWPSRVVTITFQASWCCWPCWKARLRPGSCSRAARSRRKA